MINIAEVDFKARKDGKGGSPPGTIKRHPVLILKYAARIYAIKVIGHGNESYFIHDPNKRTGRFGKRQFEVLIPILKECWSKECEIYFEGREGREAKLIADRFHKMYYINKNGIKARGIGPEHPANWDKKVLAELLSTYEEQLNKFEKILNDRFL